MVVGETRVFSTKNRIIKYEIRNMEGGRMKKQDEPKQIAYV
jgi:hypothetical protein